MTVILLTAFITGFFSLTSLLVSKEDKITESRQKWLEGLREETAKFLALIDTLMNLVEPRLEAKRKALPPWPAADKQGGFTVALIAGSAKGSIMSSFLISSEVAAVEKQAGIGVEQGIAGGVEQQGVAAVEQRLEPSLGERLRSWFGRLRSWFGIAGGIEQRVAAVEKKPAVDAFSPTELSEFRKEHSTLYNDLNEMQFRVLLRLDPNPRLFSLKARKQGKLHKHLIKQIEEMTRAFYGDCKPKDMDKVRDCKQEIILGTQKVLKGTWYRVKKGEVLFRWTRRILFGCVLLLLVLGVNFGLPYVVKFVQPYIPSWFAQKYFPGRFAQEPSGGQTPAPTPTLLFWDRGN